MQLFPNPLIIPVGLLIGVLLAAPLGPVNVLCLQRALARGFWGGIAASLGAVLGDGLVAMFAALGVGAIGGAIRPYRYAIQIVGGLALVIYGARVFIGPPRLRLISSEEERKTSLSDFIWDIPKVFMVTITNPASVLGLFAIYGGVGTFVEVASYVDAFTMVAAIMAGAMLSWIALLNFISRIRDHLQAHHIQRLNKGAALLLVLFGLIMLGEVIWKRGQLA